MKFFYDKRKLTVEQWAQIKCLRFSIHGLANSYIPQLAQLEKFLRILVSTKLVVWLSKSETKECKSMVKFAKRIFDPEELHSYYFSLEKFFVDKMEKMRVQIAQLGLAREQVIKQKELDNEAKAKEEAAEEPKPN